MFTGILETQQGLCCLLQQDSCILRQWPVYPQGRPFKVPRTTYKLVNAVKLPHAFGSVPLRLLSRIALQVGRELTSGRALHYAGRATARANPTHPALHH
jgi:hypothetical protein